MLKLYNTLTRKKQEFKPIKSEVGLYTCGPTVYFYPHIGNMRAYIFSDTLKRILEYDNYKVKHVMNVTDVGHLTSDSDEGEDKIEKEAQKEGKTAKDIAEFYFKAFKKDISDLNITNPSIWCKATEHIEEQIDLIKKLEKKKYTYKTSDGIYFDTSKFKDYGKLAKLKMENLQAGKRVEMREKKNPTDFALWKFSDKPGLRQQEWNSPWGLGFPGWHIECSAMSMKYLGDHFDIHTGGEDHIPVHHTNEIAQSEAATGKKFVNYWLHNSFLLNKEGEKISKSKGGLYTISELEKLGYNPITFRYLCLLTNYRKPLVFTLENLDAAKNAYNRLKRKIEEIKEEKHKGNDLSKDYESQFSKAINDDLNTPQAIQVIWKMMEDFDFEPKSKIKLIEKFDQALGLKLLEKESIKIPTEVKDLAQQRENLRKEKKWAEADIIRNKIKSLGYTVQDKSEGFEIQKD